MPISEQRAPKHAIVDVEDPEDFLCYFDGDVPRVGDTLTIMEAGDHFGKVGAVTRVHWFIAADMSEARVHFREGTE